MSLGNEPQPPALLLMSCSRRKAKGLERGRAWDIYDGALFQVLKKVLRDREGWEAEISVLVVSARYGIVSADRMITTYEEQLSAQTARERAARFHRQLWTWIAGRRFRAVHVNLGRHYLLALPDLESLFSPLPVDRASGGIGVRNAQTRRWVQEQLGQSVSPATDGTDERRSSRR